MLIWNFLAQNFHIFGWTGLLLFVARISWKVSALVNKFLDDITTSKERQLKMEETVDTLSTNHLPHIQTAVEETNNNTKTLIEEIKALRRDLLQFAISRK